MRLISAIWGSTCSWMSINVSKVTPYPAISLNASISAGRTTVTSSSFSSERISPAACRRSKASGRR
jgi:hypothetical protein